MRKQSFAIRLERQRDETVKPSKQLRKEKAAKSGLARRMRRMSATWERLMAVLPREPEGECRPKWKLDAVKAGTWELVGSLGGRITHEFKSYRRY